MFEQYPLHLYEWVKVFFLNAERTGVGLPCDICSEFFLFADLVETRIGLVCVHCYTDERVVNRFLD